jgi:2-polyprenyl-6-methoxyphenol hydroxylase-like FAD-dependent oxidoreductase
MKAIIIGGGIGGLTTAIALKQQGIDFEIYEAAPELKPVGAGIVMASNAMQVFQRLGIEKKIMAAGLEVQKAVGVDDKFKVISGLDVKGKVAPRYGIGSYAIHRGRLQQALLSEIDGSKVYLNKRLERVEQGDSKVKVFFQDGTSVEGDIVIGADGIKSAVRKNIFGDLPLRYSGQTCWRGMAKFNLPTDRKGNSYEMWGPKKGFRFGFAPTAPDEVYFFTTFFTSEGGRDAGPNKEKLVQLFAPFGDLPRQIIEATPEENIIRSDIHDLAPIPQWWKGRVVLLGDAAHATTPNLGQGGCQAVEDALALAQSLKQAGNHENAFKQFQSIRFSKANYVVNTSWQFGKMTNLGSPLSRWLRNTAMRMMPESMAIKTLDKILKLDY